MDNPNFAGTRHAWATALVLGLAGTATAQGPAIHLPFDESTGGVAHDSLSALEARLEGPRWSNGTAMQTGGGSLEFDGMKDRVVLDAPDAGLFADGAAGFTVSAWIRADDFGVRDGRIVSKAKSQRGRDHDFMLSTFRSNGVMGLRFRLRIGNRMRTVTARGAGLPTDQWVHVAAVFDGERMRVYQDLQQIGQRRQRGGLLTMRDDLAIAVGNQPDGAGDRGFDGRIDEVHLFDRGLDLNELQALAGPGPLTQALPNEFPIANAGPDRRVALGDVVTLDGTASTDPDGDQLTGRYVLVDGPPSNAFADDRLVTEFAPTHAATYRFRLEVSDGQDVSTDEVQIQVFACLDEVRGELVGHWAFDAGSVEAAQDLSGNANPARLVQARVVDQTPLDLGGGALDVASRDQVAVVDENLLDGVEAFTIAAWIYADDFGVRDGRIVSKASSTRGNQHDYMLATDRRRGRNGLMFRLRTGDRVHTLRSSDGRMQPNRWHHVAAVYDGSQMRLYQDGVVIGARAKSGLVQADAARLIGIGNQAPGAGRRAFDGRIDDVRLYERALDEGELAQLSDVANGTAPAFCRCADTLEAAPFGHLALNICRTSLDYGELRLDGAQPLAPTAFVFGAGTQPMQFFGTVLLPSPIVTTIHTSADAFGRFFVGELVFPEAGLLTSQAISLDPTSPMGFTMSNTLSMTFPF